MTFSKKTDKTTKQLYEELKDLKSRFVLTIPFNCSEDNLTGFIAVTGERESLPVLTFCVDNPLNKKAVVSTIVFPSSKEYNKLIESLLVDYGLHFQGENSEDYT